MNTELDAVAVASPEVVKVHHALYWSVRRELWENRSVYIAPLVVAAVMLFGFLISTISLPRRMQALSMLDPAKLHAAITRPYNVAAGLVVGTMFVVGVFYCLDALHGERRDRSILFWKSLPVSDRTTVLAKASLPLLVMPVLAFEIIVTTQIVMLMLSTMVLSGDTTRVVALWSQLSLIQMSVALIYGLAVIALWHAPIYAWMLLVSGWARRAAFLWAVLPWLALCMFEAIAFRSGHVLSFLRYRLFSGIGRAFVVEGTGGAPMDPLARLTPGRFLATPGLWIGLAVAALCLYAAVRLRRHRDPI